MWLLIEKGILCTRANLLKWMARWIYRVFKVIKQCFVNLRCITLWLLVTIWWPINGRYTSSVLIIHWVIFFLLFHLSIPGCKVVLISRVRTIQTFTCVDGLSIEYLCAVRCLRCRPSVFSVVSWSRLHSGGKKRAHDLIYAIESTVPLKSKPPSPGLTLATMHGLVIRQICIARSHSRVSSWKGIGISGKGTKFWDWFTFFLFSVGTLLGN